MPGLMPRWEVPVALHGELRFLVVVDAPSSAGPLVEAVQTQLRGQLEIFRDLLGEVVAGAQPQEGQVPHEELGRGPPGGVAGEGPPPGPPPGLATAAAEPEPPEDPEREPDPSPEITMQGPELSGPYPMPDGPGHGISQERLQRAFDLGRDAGLKIQGSLAAVPWTPPLLGQKSRVFVVLRGVPINGLATGLFSVRDDRLWHEGLAQCELRGYGPRVLSPTGNPWPAAVFRGFPSFLEVKFFCFGAGIHPSVLEDWRYPRRGP